MTVEEIVGRIKDPEYFRRQFGNEARSALVSSEIELLPATAFERLAERVVKLFREADVAIHCNATTFLGECVGMQNDRLTSAVVKKLIQSKLRANNPPGLLQAIVEVLNRQVGCIKLLSVVDRRNLDQILFGLFDVSASKRDSLRPAGSLALKLADSSNFDKVRSSLTALLTLGLSLMTNPQAPKEIRRSFAMNLRRSARDFGPDGARFVTFIQSHGEELIEVLNDKQVRDLLEALHFRRIGGPGGKNFSKTGECLTDPASMNFSEDELPLIHFEQNLRIRVAASDIAADFDHHRRPRRRGTRAQV